jgi:hypothetical protein
MPRVEEERERAGRAFTAEQLSARALGFDGEEVNLEAAKREAALRTAVIEEQVRNVVRTASVDFDRRKDQRWLQDAGETAAASLALAYQSRGAEDPEVSPLHVKGGLTLPASVVALAHAYSVANHFFW